MMPMSDFDPSSDIANTGFPLLLTWLGRSIIAACKKRDSICCDSHHDAVSDDKPPRAQVSVHFFLAVKTWCEQRK